MPENSEGWKPEDDRDPLDRVLDASRMRAPIPVPIHCGKCGIQHPSVASAQACRCERRQACPKCLTLYVTREEADACPCPEPAPPAPWKRPRWALQLPSGKTLDVERAPLLPIRIYQRLFYGWRWHRMGL